MTPQIIRSTTQDLLQRNAAAKVRSTRSAVEKSSTIESQSIDAHARHSADSDGRVLVATNRIFAKNEAYARHRADSDGRLFVASRVLTN